MSGHVSFVLGLLYDPESRWGSLITLTYLLEVELRTYFIATNNLDLFFLSIVWLKVHGLLSIFLPRILYNSLNRT